MTTKVFTVPADQLNQLETKLNELFGKPEFKGYQVAASFPNSDFSLIVIILQKT
jgi:hypothetical protein